jgi:sporulation protein YlmC with PRC-barrel domain
VTADRPTLHRDATEKVHALSRLRDSNRTVARSAEDIRGRMVKDKDGLDLGKVENLLIDDVEQKVRFMEVASGGFLGFGERKSFVPVDAITRITDDVVHISHTREHVAGAPQYDPDLVAGDPNYFFSLYPYYGYQGYLGFVPTTMGYPYAKGDTSDISGSKE